MNNTEIEQKRAELLYLVEDELHKLDKIIEHKKIELQNIINEYSYLEKLLGHLE